MKSIRHLILLAGISIISCNNPVKKVSNKECKTDYSKADYVGRFDGWMEKFFGDSTVSQELYSEMVWLDDTGLFYTPFSDISDSLEIDSIPFSLRLRFDSVREYLFLFNESDDSVLALFHSDTIEDSVRTIDFFASHFGDSLYRTVITYRQDTLGVLIEDTIYLYGLFNRERLKLNRAD